MELVQQQQQHQQHQQQQQQQQQLHQQQQQQQQMLKFMRWDSTSYILLKKVLIWMNEAGETNDE